MVRSAFEDGKKALSTKCREKNQAVLLREQATSNSVVNGSSVGLFMAKAIGMFEKNKDTGGYDLPAEEVCVFGDSRGACKGARPKACGGAEIDLADNLRRQKNKMWLSEANRSDYLNTLLRPLPVHPAQRLHVVYVRKSQPKDDQATAAIGFAGGVETCTFGEKDVDVCP